MSPPCDGQITAVDFFYLSTKNKPNNFSNHLWYNFHNYFFFQALLPESVQAEVQCDIPAKTTEKGVVVMKEMFSSLKGLQVILQVITLAVNIAVFGNSIAGVPGKGNN